MAEKRKREKKSIWKSDLDKALYEIAKNLNIATDKKSLKIITESLFEIISEAIARGKEVIIPNFGKFTVGEKKIPPQMQKGKNKKVRVVKFKPSKTLKKKLNG